jgi:hypothetical protein
MALTVPSTWTVPLELLFFAMWNNRFADVIDLNQVMPRLEIKAEYSLVFLNALHLRFIWGIGSCGLCIGCGEPANVEKDKGY